jgi:uncharacterized repeat protein (TIGR03833 family)
MLKNGGYCFMDGTKRLNIKPGIRVAIVLKKDQRSGKLTEGIVKDVLTNSQHHPHGVKVRLISSEIGRVKKNSKRLVKLHTI